MSEEETEAEYAARIIRAFLEGETGEWDWDDFTSCPLRDSAVNDLRLKALFVELPLDAEGVAMLLSLADEADLLSKAKGN